MYSPTSTAKVNNAWSYTSTSPYIFMVWYLVKHRDNFTFTIAELHVISILIVRVTTCA